jgi:hypothetical protein
MEIERSDIVARRLHESGTLDFSERDRIEQLSVGPTVVENHPAVRVS